ncbi:MAG: hypothetical protein JOY71_31765 [Acetobacteraceae bacterium]|nr:hypothetical protein [Acetobacteraceae bacterium]
MKKAEIEAQTAKTVAAGQAEAAIETARGRAGAIEQEAMTEARAIQVKDQAQPEAQQRMTEALSRNASLVEYQKATRWNTSS